MTDPVGTTVLVVHPGAELYGSDRVMLESVDAFVEAGWRVVVTVPDEGPLLRHLERPDVEVVVCPTPVLRKAYLRGLGPAQLLTRTVRSILPGARLIRRVRPDVVYVSTITVPLWLALSRLLGVSSIVHLHEAESDAPKPLRVALALPLLLARRIVVNSRFSGDVLASAISRLRSRCTVIYNGVPGPPVPTPARPTLDGPVRLLFIGRISQRKGVLDAVDAVAELSRRHVDARLEIVGSVFAGYGWVADEIDRRATDQGVADRIVRHGFDEDIWGHLERTDVLLVPSQLPEPFGNTAVEGVLAGRPVVAADIGGLPEAIGGMRGCISVRPGSPAAIADAVQQVMAEWSTYRAAALEDAPLAADRYAPATYRSAIADEVGSVLR